MLRILSLALIVAASVSSPPVLCSQEPLDPAHTAASQPESTAAAGSLTAARRQAETLHEAMHAALRIVHHQYFREDEALPIPAEILKGVFAELQQEQGVTLRWLVVDGQAMNSDHKAQDAFENEAVKALKKGEPAYERMEHGVYRRAGPITLGNHCLKCHVPNRRSVEDRTAGLLISIPLHQE